MPQPPARPEERLPEERLMVALDVPTGADALALADCLKPSGLRWVKVGMSLYYREGTAILDALRDRGYEIFVDLKLHDIPNTVARTVDGLVRAGVSFLNVHTQGGSAMMRAAADTAAQVADATGQPKPIVIGVTLLTSLSELALNEELRVSDDVERYVGHLARLAQSSGLDGVVCSAQEAARLRALCGPEFILVTPGIRPAQDAAGSDDQSRVMTPAEALAAGAHYLVVGRPIVQAPDPVAATRQLLAEMSTAVVTR
jgi:orotidine-5'-phosphate decarboxylase